MDTIKYKILKEIGEGRGKITPRYVFLLRKILLFLAIILLSLILFFLISLLVYSIQESQLNLLFGLGLRGLKIFLISLPWILITIIGLLFFTVHKLLREKGSGYHKPVLYTLLIVLIISIGGGFAIAKSPMHQKIAEAAARNNLQKVSNIYNNYAKRQMKGAFIGKVLEAQEKKIKIRELEGQDLDIELQSFQKKPIKDDTVIILGVKKNGAIKAIKIRQIKKGVGMK